MKLLFMIVNLEKGGAQRVMLNMCHALSEYHSIDIIPLRDSEIGYSIHHLNVIKCDTPIIKNRFIRFIHQRNRIKQIIEKNSYDVIISFLPEANFINTSIKTHAKKIINVRNDPKVEYRGIYHLFMRYFYPKADVCIVQTKIIQSYFTPYCSRVEIIPNPVSKIELKPISKKPIVLNVGRLVPQKNQALLIRAFKEFHHNYPNYECHIYGQGPLRGELQELIHELNCEDCIKIYEPSDQIFERMQEAEIFVLSSNYEGYPNVLLEAMACGCASISTDCASGGPRDIIQNEVNGLLIKVKDKNELIHALNRCAEPNFRQSLSQKALEINHTHAQKQFNQTYQRIIESCGH